MNIQMNIKTVLFTIMMALFAGGCFAQSVNAPVQFDSDLGINKPLCQAIKPAIEAHLRMIKAMLIADGLESVWLKEKPDIEKASDTQEQYCATYLGVVAEALQDMAAAHYAAVHK